jgi:hypothetical protein
MANPKFDVRYVAGFVAGAVESAAQDADGILWAKVDEEPTPEQRISRATMVIRENFNGAGEVKCFRITIEEVSLG